MAKKKLLEYTIHLRDKALVDSINAQLNSLAGGTLVGERIRITGGIIPVPTDEYRVLRAPYNAGPPEGGAAVEYAINAGAYPPALPIIEVGGAIPSGGAGYITSEWFTTSNTFPRNVATFTISSGWWIFGSSTKFYWGAKFEYAPPPAGPTTTGPEQIDPCPIPARRWLSGGDIADIEGALGLPNIVVSGTSMDHSRAASRKIDGFGHIMGANGGTAEVYANQYQTSFPITAWDRFYVQAPDAPDVTTQIWEMRIVAVTGVGFAVALTAGLNVAVFTMSPTQSLIGTFGSPLVAGKWYKFDCVCYIDAPNDTIYFDLYLNGAKLTSQTRGAGGLEINRLISQTILGKNNGAVLTSKARFHFDSWIVADIPQTRDRSKPAWNSATAYVVGDIVHIGSDPATWSTYRALVNNTNVPPGPPNTATWRKLKDSNDWVHGSHLQHILPKAFAATHSSNWVGDWRVLAKQMLFTGSVGTTLTCNVASSLLAVQMGMEAADGQPGAIGWVAMQGTFFVGAGGVPDGRFGYKIGAAAPVLATIVQGSGLEGHSTLFNQASSVDPTPLGTTVELHHEKAADATGATAALIQGVVELIGVFGEEDIAPNETPVPAVPEPVIDRHNTHIPRSPWANQPNAMGPVMIVSGTYVGNGLGQDIAFKVPPCFVWIRPLTGDTGGCLWWPSELDSHTNHDQGTYLFGIGPLAQDFSFAPGSPTDDQQMRWLLRLCGGGAQINQTGITYQYIAFCDPAKRFALAGVDHTQNIGTPKSHSLPISTWAPEWLFAFKDLIGSATGNELWFKDLALATDAAKNVGGAAVTANAIDMAAGSLTWRAGFVASEFDQIPYLGFRRADGNNDPGQAKVMFMGSYTGDGTASRTVSLAPVTGLRPLWAIVIPENAAAIYRDPSNTTNTSNLFGGTTTATGITGGGIDSFSVGTTLNANGVVYHYFGFWGNAAAGNGGWSGQAENVPVITEAPVLPDVADEPIEVPSTTTTVPITGEPDLENSTVILDSSISVGGTVGGQVCEFYTRELMNIALQHIGISKVIGNLQTEQSEAAAQARRFVRKDVNAVLRDYPWDFATAYQNLVLATGSISAPANNDWTYAYTAPNAMMLARRIAKLEKGRKFDPEPIPFREGLFNNRPCIFANVLASATVPLVLEYTVRNSCPAFYGDALFREALTWKFAASFAMTLARDKDKQDYCLRVYNALLPKAKVVDANEQQQEPPGDADWISGRN